LKELFQEVFERYQAKKKEESEEQAVEEKETVAHPVEENQQPPLPPPQQQTGNILDVNGSDEVRARLHVIASNLSKFNHFGLQICNYRWFKTMVLQVYLI